MRPIPVCAPRTGHTCGPYAPSCGEPTSGSQDQSDWFSYFASASTTGLTWTDDPFVPIFQSSMVLTTDRLVRSAEHIAPSLERIATRVVDADAPALCFDPVHPYARGVVVSRSDGASRAQMLEPGEPCRYTAHPASTASTWRP